MACAHHEAVTHSKKLLVGMEKASFNTFGMDKGQSTNVVLFWQ